MIKVRVINGLDRVDVMCPETMTLKECLEEQEVNYGAGKVSLDGTTLGLGDINKSFEECGVRDTATLAVTIKTDNA